MPEKLIDKHKRVVTSGSVWFCAREDTSIGVILAKRRHLPRGWFILIEGDLSESMSQSYSKYREALNAYDRITDGVTKEQLAEYGFRQR